MFNVSKGNFAHNRFLREDNTVLTSKDYEFVNFLFGIASNAPVNRVWKGFRVIRELTKKQSVNRENSWNTAVIRELYIHCDA